MVSISSPSNNYDDTKDKFDVIGGTEKVCKKKNKHVLRGYCYVTIGIVLLLGPISGIDWDRPQLRLLTYVPVVLVLCISHWVSLRIYLRQ